MATSSEVKNMGGKLFDDLLQIIEGQVTMNGTSTVSVEIDLNIPRGFIFKIKQAELILAQFLSDIDNGTVDLMISIAMALILDPDDSTTTTRGSNDIDTDVLLDHEFSFQMDIAGTTFLHRMFDSPTFKIQNYEDLGVDVITARNVRVNGVGFEDDGSVITEAQLKGVLYGTWEKVKSEEILAILDIL